VMSPKALYVPANTTQPVQEIEVNGISDVSDVVSGAPEATRYDRDSVLWVNDTGRIDGMMMNTRATDYIKSDSAVAKQGRMKGVDPEYGLYGPVVITGEELSADVPERLIERFAPEQSADMDIGF
jgi:hypothetical protein